MGEHNQNADKSRKCGCSGCSGHSPVKQEDADIVQHNIEKTAHNTRCHNTLWVVVVADKYTQKIVDYKQNSATV